MPTLNEVSAPQQNLIIRSLHDSTKHADKTIAFSERIRKVVLDKMEQQAFVLLENQPHVYRILIKKLIDAASDDFDQEILTKLDLKQKKDKNQKEGKGHDATTPVDDILVARAAQKYAFQDQEYLYAIKGHAILRFKICPKNKDTKEQEMKIEEYATSYFKIQCISAEQASRPRLVELPGKSNLFMVFNNEVVEVVGCDNNNDFGAKASGAVVNNFHYEHDERHKIKCHASNILTAPRMDYNRKETALVALAYDDGAVYLFHSEELQQQMPEPKGVIKLKDDIVDMAFVQC